MAGIAFIQDKLEIKFLILYIAARLIEPVPFEALQELCMCDDGVNFFDFSDCLSSLVFTEHLSLSKDGLYSITGKGLHNGKICESSLPYSIRLTADKLVTVYNQKLRRSAQVKANYTACENGTFCVTLAFCDNDDSPLLKMDLTVPNASTAKNLANRFKENAEQLYTDVINALFADNENK